MTVLLSSNPLRLEQMSYTQYTVYNPQPVYYDPRVIGFFNNTPQVYDRYNQLTGQVERVERRIHVVENNQNNNHHSHSHSHSQSYSQNQYGNNNHSHSHTHTHYGGNGYGNNNRRDYTAPMLTSAEAMNRAMNLHAFYPY